MFGHNDDQNQPQGNNNSADSQDTSNGTSDASSAADQGIKPLSPITPADQSWQHPGSPLGDDSEVAVTTPKPEPGTSTPESTTPSEPSATPGAPTLTPGVTAAPTQDLADLKQQALTKLSPLVSKLDQTPEEKFRTLMMLIQASDDQTKLKEAYEVAQSIPDEKTRAQALLDVINEINYFTQQKN